MIRHEESGGEAHHGGAWKVAYADFVTAMMVFFLLMWLLNSTSEEQKRGLADYFSASSTIGSMKSGKDMPLGGKTPYDEGELVSDRGTMSIMPADAIAPPEPEEEEDAESSQQSRTLRRTADAGSGPGKVAGPGASDAAPARFDASGRALAREPVPLQAMLLPAEAGRAEQDPREQTAREQAMREQAMRERDTFARAAEQIRAAVRSDPALNELARQIAIDETPEGLRIQILDEDRLPMFATGSAVLNERARRLLEKVVPVLARLPEPISLAGHTDATPYRGGDRSNWELSADRANATRRLLVEAGLQDTRFRSVTGNADRDPLLPANPHAAANRRIAIVVLRGTPKY
ncbi:flagellar motor protein MotB [Rhodovastum atsumiense]|uniref:flagellar motor protein MotB n=1 Tax=Rhodovastum atsumiense TaxID=504468 RepID=UPI00139F292D|nr:flagellar motor protein MotB [Rhodovastum atsumiense]